MDLAEVHLDLSAVRHHRPAGDQVTLRGVRDRVEAVGEVEIQRELSLTRSSRRGAGRAAFQERLELRVLPGPRSQLQHESVDPGATRVTTSRAATGTGAR